MQWGTGMISFNTLLAIHRDFAGELYRSASTLQARHAARVASTLELGGSLAFALQPRAVMDSYLQWYSSTAASLADDVEEQFQATARMIGKVMSMPATAVSASAVRVAEIEKIRQQAAEPPAARSREEDAMTRDQAA